MKKIRKTFWYLLGSFMAFTFNLMGVSAQMQTLYGVEPRPIPLYGINPISEPTVLNKILSVILSPIVIVIVIILVFALGVIIFIKRKSKNVKRDS